MCRLLILLTLAVSLFAQQRHTNNFFDASTRCIPGPSNRECVLPEETVSFIPKPAAPSVSVYRLSHKVPGKASKAFKRATDAALNDRPQESIAFLDEALKQDADFADALHLRGLFAYQFRDFERAAVMLQRAAALDTSNPIFLADAAVGHLTMRNPVEAERNARAALRLSPLHKRALEVLNRLKP